MSTYFEFKGSKPLYDDIVPIGFDFRYQETIDLLWYIFFDEIPQENHERRPFSIVHNNIYYEFHFCEKRNKEMVTSHFGFLLDSKIPFLSFDSKKLLWKVQKDSEITFFKAFTKDTFFDMFQNAI